HRAALRAGPRGGTGPRRRLRGRGRSRRQGRAARRQGRRGRDAAGPRRPPRRGRRAGPPGRQAGAEPPARGRRHPGLVVLRPPRCGPRGVLPRPQAPRRPGARAAGRTGGPRARVRVRADGPQQRTRRRRPARAGSRRLPGGRLMFTGIVEEGGAVADVRERPRGSLRVAAAASLPFVPSLAIGDSVSVSGCCLTVVERATGSNGTFQVDLVEETVGRTAPRWQPGADVNLEQAMRAGAALGGHVVTGHVDGVAEVVCVDATPGAHVVRFRAPARLAGQVVPKGSVAIDGVSLTVVD